MSTLSAIAASAVPQPRPIVPTTGTARASTGAPATDGTRAATAADPVQAGQRAPGVYLVSQPAGRMAARPDDLVWTRLGDAPQQAAPVRPVSPEQAAEVRAGHRVYAQAGSVVVSAGLLAARSLPAVPSAASTDVSPTPLAGSHDRTEAVINAYRSNAA